MKQEMEDDRVTRNRFKEEEEGEIESNPYQMAILNKTPRNDTKIEQMINWSILSDLIKYVDGSSCSDTILCGNHCPDPQIQQCKMTGR